MRAVAASAILDAAEAVVAEQGADSARIEEIAKRAGVAVGTVYNYYSDRDALMTALRAERKRELVDALKESLSSHAGQKVAVQLDAFLRAIFSYYDAHRQFFVMLLSSVEVRTKMQHAGPDVFKEVFAVTETLIRAGVEEKALRKEYAELYPAMLFGMVRAASMSELHRKRTTPLVELVAPLVDLFLHGAGKPR